MVWSPGKDGRRLTSQICPVQLATPTQTQVWAKKEVERCSVEVDEEVWYEEARWSRAGFLINIEVDEEVWYEEARRSRVGWRAVYRTDCRENQVSQASEVAKEVVCELCSRAFRRESDKKHHKCVTERQNLLVNSKEQHSAHGS